MRQIRHLIAASMLLAAANVSAQKITSFEDTQARIVDTYAHAYVRPLTCELQVKERVEETLHYTPEEVEAMSSGNTISLDNLRSRAVFDLAKLKQADAIVAATFNIKGKNTAGFDVTVKGFSANFTNWSTATEKDYIWIFRDGALTTADAQRGGATGAIRR
jgi:hypothetical protein